MAIISTPVSVDQKYADDARYTIAAMYAAITQTAGNITRFIWANPNLTPQQAFDLFDTDAEELCRLSNAFIAMESVYTGVEPPVLPAGITLVRNGNGTITVAYDATQAGE